MTNHHKYYVTFLDHGSRMVWVERDLKDHLVLTPLPRQARFPLDQVAQSSMQPGLEHLQEWGIHSFSGQSIPVPQHPHSKELPSNI